MDGSVSVPAPPLTHTVVNSCVHICTLHPLNEWLLIISEWLLNISAWLLNTAIDEQLCVCAESAAGPILVPIVQFTEYSTQVSAETVVRTGSYTCVLHTLCLCHSHQLDQFCHCRHLISEFVALAVVD